MTPPRLLALLIMSLLASVTPAAADTWQVDYISASNWGSTFYPAGAYFFLCCDNGGAGGVLYGMTGIPSWQYLPGYYVYGATPLVPGDIPQITLTSNAFNPGTGTFEAVAVNISGGGGGGGSVVAVPELVIFRQLGLLGSKWGPRFEGVVSPTLQRLTAWGAAKMLGAPSSGEWIFLPTTYLEVQQWCSGLMTIKGLMLIAFAFGLAGWLAGWFTLPWACALVGVAGLIGVEVNILRVAGIGLGLEHYGLESRHLVKEWMGWGAVAAGVGQLVGCAWIARRGATR